MPWPRDCKLLGLKIGKEAMETSSSATGLPLSAPLKFDFAVNRERHFMAYLSSLVFSLCHMAETRDEHNPTLSAQP